MVKFPFKKYQLVQQAKPWGYLFSFQSKITSSISVKGMPPRSGASQSLPGACTPGPVESAWGLRLRLWPASRSAQAIRSSSETLKEIYFSAVAHLFSLLRILRHKKMRAFSNDKKNKKCHLFSIWWGDKYQTPQKYFRKATERTVQITNRVGC